MHYHRELQKRFRKLTQGHRSVDEYFEEFELLKNRLELEETEEALMAQFVDGLQERIARKVERMTYNELNELKHLAVQVEQQAKKKVSQARQRPNTPWHSNDTPIKPSDKGKQVEIESRFKPRTTEPSKPSQPEANKGQSSTSRTRDLTCFRCQGRGHMVKDCPNRRTMIITANGDYESQDEANEEDDESNEEVEYPEDGELLVLRRVLSTQVQLDETAQRNNLFHTRCTIHDKVCSLIIDGGSCANVASTYLVNKLGLERVKRPQPYKLRWLNDKVEMEVVDQVTIPFNIGRYHDQVTCDVVPMQAGHLLLGRPWQFDRETQHDGRTNLYSLVHDKRKYVLAPLSPLQVHEMQAKLSKEMKVSGSTLYLRSDQVIKALDITPHLAAYDLQRGVSADLVELEPPPSLLDRFEDEFPKEGTLGLPFIASIGQRILKEHGISKDVYIKKLYQHVHAQLEKKTRPSTTQKLMTTKEAPYKRLNKEWYNGLDLESRGESSQPEVLPHQRDEALKEHINQLLKPQGKLDPHLSFKDTNFYPFLVGTPIKRMSYGESVMSLDLKSSGVDTWPEKSLQQRSIDEALNKQKLELQGKIETYHKFKDTNLLSLHVGEEVLRTKPFQGGGNDVVIPPAMTLKEEDLTHESFMFRELSQSAHEEEEALFEQEYVDAYLGELHSFSHSIGFIPRGFPCMVFNEVTIQGPSSHMSYLAPEQENKGAPQPPLLQASSFPNPDSLVPFMKMGLDEYEDDFSRFEATNPNKYLQDLTFYLKMDSHESRPRSRDCFYKTPYKMLPFTIINPLVRMFMLFLFQPKKPKPKRRLKEPD